MIRAYMGNIDLPLENIEVSTKTSQSNRKNIAWNPPPTNFVKLNFDGSKLQDGRTAYEFVIRDEVG